MAHEEVGNMHEAVLDRNEQWSPGHRFIKDRPPHHLHRSKTPRLKEIQNDFKRHCLVYLFVCFISLYTVILHAFVIVLHFFIVVLCLFCFLSRCSLPLWSFCIPLRFCIFLWLFASLCVPRWLFQISLQSFYVFVFVFLHLICRPLKWHMNK